MDKRKLKNTNLEVSRVCLGTMTFGSQVDTATAASMVDYSFDRGVNFLDTANVYNKGKSEEILAGILRNRRDQFVLASKVGLAMGDSPDESGLSPAAINKGIEDSLRRLQTDYLDIFYLHAPDSSTPIESTLETANQLVTKGKVRYLGASNFSSWQVCQMLWIADQLGYDPITIVQPMYNLLARGVEQEFLPMCESIGPSVVSYNPLAGGLLTGKQKSESPIKGSRFDNNKGYLDRFWYEQNFEAIASLVTVADKEGRSPASLALNWVYHHTTVDSVIIGASRQSHLVENLDSFNDGPLSENTLEVCEATWAKLKGVSPNYNR